MQANFANIYSFLNDADFYQDWFEFLSPYLNTPKNILDLGCGNATLLKKLRDAGHQITGVDNSSDMLMLAADTLGTNAVLFEMDMCDFCTDSAQYDIIISTCDSLNYLSNTNKLEQVFANVNTMLKEDGFFIFDVHSEFTFEHRFPNWSYGDATEDLSVIWNIETLDGFQYEHFLTFYLLQENGSYERFDDIQREYFYHKDELIALLKKQQFSDIQYMSDFQMTYDEEGQRTFFIAKKTRNEGMNT